MSHDGGGRRDLSAASEFALRVFLEGMDPEDDFQVVLPIGYARNSIGWLLDRVFPADEQDRNTIEASLDVRANPDLPDIYAVMLQVAEEWRIGLCALSVSTGCDHKLDLADPASNHLVRPSPDDEPSDGCADVGAPSRWAPMAGRAPYHGYDLLVAQEYSALEYAVAQGFWQSRDELLDWLRGLTVLYFMDKFEHDIPAPDPDSGEDPILGVAGLQDENLAALCEDTGRFFITENGRGLIGRLLVETESYIEQYDHFKDVDFDDDADEVGFDHGRGVDLRAQVFIAEGLDPVRTVFLLRLYDGAMDEAVSNWTELIEDEGFFDKFLEPVVNRYNVSEELIGKVIDAGYAYVEERHDQARQLAAEREIVSRARDAASSPSPAQSSITDSSLPPARESTGSDGHEQDQGGGDDHRALDVSDSHAPLPGQGVGNTDAGKQQ